MIVRSLFYYQKDGAYSTLASAGNDPGTDVSCFSAHETSIKVRSCRQGEQTQGLGHADEREKVLKN